ncbi:MAG: 50S ribosomal protein L10 [Peptococcia bacterium]
MGSLEAKKQLVTEIKEKLNKAQSVVVVENKGLTVKQVTELRNKLREAGCEYKVYKNTLVNLAAQENEIEGLDEFLQGPNAWAFSMDDPVAAAKILLPFVKASNEKIAIKGGILENRVIGLGEVKALADLPSREVLLAQVLGALQSPLVGMANVLQGPIRKMGYALEAVRKSKEAEA